MTRKVDSPGQVLSGRQAVFGGWHAVALGLEPAVTASPSLQVTARAGAPAAWTIENKVNWVHDSRSARISSRVRTGPRSSIMATLRNLAIELIRQADDYTRIAATICKIKYDPALLIAIRPGNPS